MLCFIKEAQECVPHFFVPFACHFKFDYYLTQEPSRGLPLLFILQNLLYYPTQPLENYPAI